MKKSNIVRKKTNYLTGLKALSSWMTGTRRDEKELEYIISKYEFNTTIFKRLISYIYNSPHIVWYINKYLNDLYNFNKMNLINLIYSFVYLLDINQKNQMKKLFYIKSDDLADRNKTKIKTLLNDFFSKLYDKNYNEQELNFFYDLFNLGYITVQDITEIDLHLNNNKTTVELDQFQAYQKQPQNITTNTIPLDIYRTLPENISKYCDEIKMKILNRKKCQQCELFGKPSVIVDTNVNDFGEVDIIFIGLNPGKDEVILNKPFVGKSGIPFREKLAKLPANVKWVITNIMLCHTRNEKEIKNPEVVIENCQELLVEITSKFPAKYYVPLGAKAAKAMGLDQGISSISGKKFTKGDFTIIPIIHPSNAVNYGQMDKFNESFETIYELFKDMSVSKPATIQQRNLTMKSAAVTEIKTSQNNNRFITEVTDDLTLFDIREINNKIVKIFIDKDFNKKYLIEDYEFSFYIHSGSWNTCSQIIDNVDFKVVIPGNLKTMATKKVRDKLNQIKEK